MYKILRMEHLSKSQQQTILLPEGTKILAAICTPDLGLSLMTERMVDGNDKLGRLAILCLALNNEYNLEGWSYLNYIDTDEFDFFAIYYRWVL